MNRVHWFLIPLGIVGLQGCSSEDGTASGRRNSANDVMTSTYEGDAVMADNVHPLTQTLADVALVYPDRLVFPAKVPEIPAVRQRQAGDLLSSMPSRTGQGNPLGFFRRVKRIESSNDTVTVWTTNGHLSEFFKGGGFKLKSWSRFTGGPNQPGPQVKGLFPAPPGLRAQDDGAANASSGMLKGLNVEQTPAEGFTLTPSLEFNPHMELAFHTGATTGHTFFYLDADATLKADLKLDFAFLGSGSSSKAQGIILGPTAPAVFPTPFPTVVITVRLQLGLECSKDLSAKATYTQSFHFSKSWGGYFHFDKCWKDVGDIGVPYEGPFHCNESSSLVHSKWNDAPVSLTADPPVLSVSGTAKIECALKPALLVNLWDMGGPEIYFRFGGGAKAEYTLTNPSYCGLETGLVGPYLYADAGLAPHLQVPLAAKEIDLSALSIEDVVLIPRQEVPLAGVALGPPPGCICMPSEMQGCTENAHCCSQNCDVVLKRCVCSAQGQACTTAANCCDPGMECNQGLCQKKAQCPEPPVCTGGPSCSDATHFTTCETGPDGCARWGAPQACSAGQQCSAGNCVTGCKADGQPCADPSECCQGSCVSGVCQASPQCSCVGKPDCADDGCGNVCAGQCTGSFVHCSGLNGSCVSVCNNQCSTAGDLGCSGNYAMQCQADPQGCLSWVTVNNCGAGLCNAGRCCNNDCNDPGGHGCLGDLLTQCLQVWPGCNEITVVNDCTNLSSLMTCQVLQPQNQGTCCGLSDAYCQVNSDCCSSVCNPWSGCS